MLALLYGAESGTPNCCCSPLISLLMAISSGSVEELRSPISFPFRSSSDEELAFPISVFMDISLVGASIFPPSIQSLPFGRRSPGSKESEQQNLSAQSSNRLTCFSAESHLVAQTLRKSRCVGLAELLLYSHPLLKSIGVQGKGGHNIQMHWKSRSARVD